MLSYPQCALAFLKEGINSFIWIGDNSKWNSADTFENINVIILLSYNQAEISLRGMCLAKWYLAKFVSAFLWELAVLVWPLWNCNSGIYVPVLNGLDWS